MAYSYERRNALARSKGFASYSQYRRATEFARDSPQFTEFIEGPVGGRTGANLDEVRLFWQAFHEGDDDDYSLQHKGGELTVRTVGGKPRGAKAKWIIDVAGYIDESEWKRRYPRGRRR